MNWYMEVLRKYAQFDGRARRKEYWMFALINLLITMAISIVGGIFASMLSHGHLNRSLSYLFVAPVWIYCMAVVIPSLAVSVRRLHDTGRSGWWLLIGFVPVAGGIILLVLYCIDSQPGPNQYGPNPKEISAYGQIPPPVPGY